MNIWIKEGLAFFAVIAIVIIMALASVAMGA